MVAHLLGLIDVSQQIEFQKITTYLVVRVNNERLFVRIVRRAMSTAGSVVES